MAVVGARLVQRRSGITVVKTTDRLVIQSALLLGLAVLYSVGFSYTQWQERVADAWLSSSSTALPIAPVVWFTGMWLLFATTLAAVLTSTRLTTQPADGYRVRQLSVAAVVLAYAAEFGARIMVAGPTSQTSSGRGPLLFVGIAAALAGLAAVLRWPPSFKVLSLVLFAGGMLARLARIAMAPLDPDHADNLVSVSLSLRRLMDGLTPYAVYDFSPSHQVAMPYLPWTLLSYLPPFLLGADIRITNLVLSAGLTGLLVWTIRRLLCDTLPAFGWIVLGQPARDWDDLSAWRAASVSYSLVWQAVLRDGLSRIQPLIFVLTGVVAWLRLRTLPGLIGLAAASYLALVLSGPHIMPHMPAVVLYLALLTVAVRAQSTAGGATEVTHA